MLASRLMLSSCLAFRGGWVLAAATMSLTLTWQVELENINGRKSMMCPPKLSLSTYRRSGLVVKAYASRTADLALPPSFAMDIFQVKSYSSSCSTRRLALQGQHWDWLAWYQYTVLDETVSLICNFYLNVAASTAVWAEPSLRYTNMLLGR